jgi:hypothetical protein
MLIVSAGSDTGDTWFAHRDATYPTNAASLVQDGGVYVSLASAANTTVIDKVGWGAQVPGGDRARADHRRHELGAQARRGRRSRDRHRR